MNATINTMPETDNGSHQVPGMCYVPWQTFGKTYDPMRGLSAAQFFRNWINHLPENAI